MPLLAILVVGAVAGSEAGSEPTVTIPESMLAHLTIPLFVDHRPSDELATVLDLSADERDQIATAIADVRAGFFDHLLTEVEVAVARDDKLELTIPPLGEAGASYPASLSSWIETIIGQERFHHLRLLAQSQSIHHRSVRFMMRDEPENEAQRRERLDATLRDRLARELLLEMLDDAIEHRVEVTFEVAGKGWNGEPRWRTETKTFDADGNSRGSSSSSGGALDSAETHLHGLIIEHFGVIDPEADAADEAEAQE